MAGCGQQERRRGLSSSLLRLPPAELPARRGSGQAGTAYDCGILSLNLHYVLCMYFQFLKTGNDLAARDTCPCIWITNPRETGKVLQYVLNFMEIRAVPSIES